MIGAVILLTSGALDSLGNDMGTNIVAIVILGGAVSLLIWKNILNKKNTVEDVSTKKTPPVKPPNANIVKPKVNTNKKEIISFSQNKNSPVENIQLNMFTTIPLTLMKQRYYPQIIRMKLHYLVLKKFPALFTVKQMWCNRGN